MEEIKIVLPIDPIAWRRPGQHGEGRYDTQKALKISVGQILYHGMSNRKPLTGPIALRAEFHINRPKYKSKLPYGSYHSNKPDLDNLLKFILDAANEICWLDDSQICVIHAEKRYAKEGRIELIFTEVTQ